MAGASTGRDTKEYLASATGIEEVESPIGDEKPGLFQMSDSSSNSSVPSEKHVSVQNFSDLASQGNPVEPNVVTVGEDPLTRHITGASLAAVLTSDPAFEVDFSEDDTGNPRNWPMWYRSIIIFIMSYSTMTVYVSFS